MDFGRCYRIISDFKKRGLDKKIEKSFVFRETSRTLEVGFGRQVSGGFRETLSCNFRF